MERGERSRGREVRGSLASLMRCLSSALFQQIPGGATGRCIRPWVGTYSVAVTEFDPFRLIVEPSLSEAKGESRSGRPENRAGRAGFPGLKPASSSSRMRPLAGDVQSVPRRNGSGDLLSFLAIRLLFIRCAGGIRLRRAGRYRALGVLLRLKIAPIGPVLLVDFPRQAVRHGEVRIEHFQ